MRSMRLTRVCVCVYVCVFFGKGLFGLYRLLAWFRSPAYGSNGRCTLNNAAVVGTVGKLKIGATTTMNPKFPAILQTYQYWCMMTK